MCVASSARGSAERRARGTQLPEAGSAAALSAAEGLPTLAARGGCAPGQAAALTLRCCAGSSHCAAFVRGGRRWRWSPPRRGSPCTGAAAAPARLRSLQGTGLARASSSTVWAAAAPGRGASPGGRGAARGARLGKGGPGGCGGPRGCFRAMSS